MDGGIPARPRLDELRHRLWVHVVAYALVLLAVMVVVPIDSSFGGDDGAYGGQAHSLDDGSWAMTRPLPVVAAEHEGWLNTTVTPEGPVLYTASPGYVLVLRRAGELLVGSTGRAGERAIGYQLLPVLGALAAAAMAWALARTVTADTIGRRSTAPALAFWLVGLGPVLVNSTTLWAHTLSTALGGASLWCLALLADTGTRPVPPARVATLLAALAATLVVAAALRTEAVFWLAAIGITATIVLWRRAALLGAWLAVAAGLAVWVINRSWGASLRADRLPIDTAVVGSEDSAAWLAGRVPAAWRLLLTSLGGGIGPLLALLATVLALLGALSYRRALGADGDADARADGDRGEATDGWPQALGDRAGDQLRAGTTALLAAAGCLVAHAILARGEAISGTVAAWPIVPVLVVAGSGRLTGSGGGSVVDRRWRLLLVVPIGVLTAAVLATQYSISGGHQWGGRYLSMAFVPLAVLAALCGASLIARRDMRPALLAILLVPAVVGAATTYELHVRHRDLATATVEIPADVVITPIVALPRVAWTELPTAYYLADESTIGSLLADLAEAGVGTVNVHGLDETPVDGVAGYRVTARTDSIRHLERTSD